jgi:hypothetical protein
MHFPRVCLIQFRVEVEALEFMQPNDLHGTVRVIFIQSVDGIMLRQSLS